jgi:glycosyltransferase involved in cell wall biosynthesis
VEVDIVVPGVRGAAGIIRYVTSLRSALDALGVEVRLTGFRYLPGSERRTALRAWPIGVDRAEDANRRLVHLAQIVGSTMLLRPRPPRPVVVTAHDLGALYCPEDRAGASRLEMALFRPSMWGVRRADRIIAVSEYTRQGLIRAGCDPARTVTVYHGVEHERYTPGAEDVERLTAEYGLDVPAGVPIVLYVGNEQPRKNLSTLVDALAEVKRSGQPFRWIKVGASSPPAARDGLRRLIAARGLEAEVCFVERVGEDDLPRFYRAATVYVQPSVWEGFGLPVLEAMACGTPVVASDATSIPEVAGGAVSLVEPRSAAAFATAIGRLLDDSTAREQQRAAGIARAAAFTWARAAAETRAVYEAVR